jgi:threonine dehydrogenase-like Zn-dependent dehydrogenase
MEIGGMRRRFLQYTPPRIDRVVTPAVSRIISQRLRERKPVAVPAGVAFFRGARQGCGGLRCDQRNPPERGGIMRTMRAARLHQVGKPMVIEQLPVPEPRPTDVLVEVKACGIVPNLGNVLANWQRWFPELPLPQLPAVFGLDAAGVVAETGNLVQHFAPGDRVYVNPGLTCGSCRACRDNDPMNCRNYTFQGYFGFGPQSQKQFAAYPYAGLAEYMTAPQHNLVRLPDAVSFEQAARFGYLGTAYAALRKADAGPGQCVLINGISGTLGLGAALLALGRGVTRILGTGRDRRLLERVKALAPTRIEVLPLGAETIADRVRAATEGLGADIAVDCLGPGSPGTTMIDAIYALRRGGTYLNIGGMAETVPMNVHWMMDEQIAFIGSNWFTPGEGQAMAEMARAGTLDLAVFEHRRFKLADINQALENIPKRDGGFTNFVVIP